jgi:hypothetical protein
MDTGRRIRVIMLLVLVVFGVARAGAQTSVGLILGEPTGLSARMGIGASAAVDLAVAWSFLGDGTMYVHGDYQQYFSYPEISNGQLFFYVGVGPKFYIGNQVNIGLRIPLGALYIFSDLPLEAFIELAPGMLLFPETQIDGGGGIGLRYFLGR